MQAKIAGTTMPILELTMTAARHCRRRRGRLLVTPGFTMETSTAFRFRRQGGFMSGLKRALGGGQLFLTEYGAPGDGGFVAFAAQLPGYIREFAIDPSDHFMVQSGLYLVSTPDVEVSVGLQKKLGAGIFGGAGVIFQRLAGTVPPGSQLAGEIVGVRAAGRPVACSIHPGHLALFRAEMTLEFATVKGSRQVLRRLAVPGPDLWAGTHLAAVDDPGQAGRRYRALPARQDQRLRRR